MSGQLIFLIAIGAIFYLLILAPQRRRVRQQQEMTARLTPGVEVMTTSGLLATVAEVTDDEVLLEVAPGLTQRYVKGAIARVVTPVVPEAELDELETGGGDDEAPGTGPDSTEGPAAPREP